MLSDRMEKNKSGEPIPAASNGKGKFQRVYRYIKALSPFPYLARARDYYVRSMTECAGRGNYTLAPSGPYAGTDIYLPKSFSVNSAREREDDEFRELIRAASERRSSPAVDSGAGSRVLPRSVSTQVGRIDEDSPCYFPASFRKTVIVDSRDLPFSRSRSCTA